MDYINYIQESIDFLEQNVKNEVSISEAMKNSCYSYPHFYRIFSAIVGDSVGSYFKKRKLSCAAEELVKSEKSISDIALDYGFGSQQTFNRAFTNLFGVSPLQYRRNGMLDDICKPVHLNKTEPCDVGDLKVQIEELPPMIVASYKEYKDKISANKGMEETEKVISKAWGSLVRWQMAYEYKKRYGTEAKIPKTIELAEFFINQKLHIPPATRYFGFNNPYPAGENEFGYEAWAVLKDMVEERDSINPGIQIKKVPGGLYATAEATYGENSNLDEVWKKIHLWLFQNNQYEYGEHQWLEEHKTIEGEGGFHSMKVYLPINKTK